MTGWRNYRGVLPAFAEHFRCLVLEFPGFGVSDDFGGHPMVTAFGAVPAFVEALGLEQFSIVGNSMGGGVGIGYAIGNPDKVRKLVTIGGIGTNLLSPGPPRASGCRRTSSTTPAATRWCGGCTRWSTTRRW